MRSALSRRASTKGLKRASSPKVALAVLSAMDPSTLADAVAREDLTAICEAPGVGNVPVRDTSAIDLGSFEFGYYRRGSAGLALDIDVRGSAVFIDANWKGSDAQLLFECAIGIDVPYQVPTAEFVPTNDVRHATVRLAVGQKAADV